MSPTNGSAKTGRFHTGWNVLLFALLLGSFVLAYFPVWEGLIGVWSRSDEYSHGFFMVPAAIYILWQKRERLSEIPVTPSGWGLVMVVFSLLVYLLSHLADIATLKALTLVPLVAGVVVYFYGFPMLKELLFPIFILLFMIPVPSQVFSKLTIPLQLFVSKVSAGIADLIGVSIFRQGNVLHTPEQSFQVVQACSGLRSMITLLILSALYGYFTLRSNVLRTLLFFSGIPVAILVNIIRVLMMVLVAYYFSYDLTEGTIHTLFGLSIFVIALFFLFLIQNFLGIWDKSAQKR